ncbi:MAG: hypothetical protein K6B41_09180 [Butyrivibrio sp.]|nr:hypothetical protein [Butyrivibrio sp.]
MKNILEGKAYGICVVALSFIVAVIALIRYLLWAPAHNTTNFLVVAALVIGIIINVIVVFKDEDILLVALTACYSFAVFRHLADQVGSFVDAFQGINMFGDATQVGNIISIAIIMGASVLLAIISGFVKREK